MRLLALAKQCRRGHNSPSILEGVPEGRGSNIDIKKSPIERMPAGRGSNIKHQKSPIEHIQLPDSSNGLTALAEAPTPAYGHPFPKEGELSFDRCYLQWTERSSRTRSFFLFLTCET